MVIIPVCVIYTSVHHLFDLVGVPNKLVYSIHIALQHFKRDADNYKLTIQITAAHLNNHQKLSPNSNILLHFFKIAYTVVLFIYPLTKNVLVFLGKGKSRRATLNICHTTSDTFKMPYYSY